MFRQLPFPISSSMRNRNARAASSESLRSIWRNRKSLIKYRNTNIRVTSIRTFEQNSQYKYPHSYFLPLLFLLAVLTLVTNIAISSSHSLIAFSVNSKFFVSGTWFIICKALKVSRNSFKMTFAL